MTQAVDIGKLGVEIDYHNINMKDLTPRYTTETRGDGSTYNKVREIEIGGEKFKPSDRFFNSLCSRYGFSPSIFSLFNPDEVFERIVNTKSKTDIRVAVRRRPGSNDPDTLLAVSSPNRPIITLKDLDSILNKTERTPEDVMYLFGDGVVRSVHPLDHTVTVGKVRDQISEVRTGNAGATDDVYKFRFYLDVPIDGYGSPIFNLGWLRFICLNGTVAMDSVFQTMVNFGKNTDDVVRPMIRNLDAFSNEEGFAAISDRLIEANKVPASLAEYAAFKRAMSSALHDGLVATDLFGRLDRVAGSISERFHIPSINTVSQKKQRLLDMACSVGDLINFGTELQTHHTDAIVSAVPLQRWVGNTITNEFDHEDKTIKRKGSDGIFLDGLTFSRDTGN